MGILKLTQNKKIRSLLWWIMLILISLKLTFYLSGNRQFFLRVFDPLYFGDLYSKSQYVLGPKSKGGIGDDGLYAFAGYYYLFQKGDVSAVNFEHPPLGKYLIGLSILIFRNENIINIIYFCTLLFVTYRIGKIILKDSIFSLAAVGILSVDPLFLDNLIRSLLDLPFTIFFTAAVYFFLLGFSKSRYYYLSMIFWGAAFSTRFFPFLVFIYIFLFITVFFYRRSHVITFLVASLFIPIIYLVSHISFFLYHPSVVEFLRHKKWMLAWFSSSIAIFGNIWRNIFTGVYLDPTGKLAVNKQWSMLVPIVVSLALIPMRRIFNKNNINLLILYGLCILYLIYLTVLTDGVEKFLMPVYPLLCIIAVGNLASLYSIIKGWKKSMLPR